MDEKRGEKRRRRRRAKAAYGDVDVKAPNIAGATGGRTRTNMNKIFQKERGGERRGAPLFLLSQKGVVGRQNISSKESTLSHEYPAQRLCTIPRKAKGVRRGKKGERGGETFA